MFDYEKTKRTCKSNRFWNLSFQKKFVTNITNLIEDLDEDGIEDAFDSDVDGDGFSNDQEVALVLTRSRLTCKQSLYDLLLTNVISLKTCLQVRLWESLLVWRKI